jgi:hypothetical protein
MCLQTSNLHWRCLKRALLTAQLADTNEPLQLNAALDEQKPERQLYRFVCTAA